MSAQNDGHTSRRTLRKVEAARKAWVLAPANSPEAEAAADRVYELIVGPPPRNSVPLRVCEA